MKTPFLKKKIIKIFQKYGLSKDHASISANALINAELVGAYGHGLSRLKMYCDRISKKVINPKPKIKVKKISQSISHIDANNSIGFVAADLGIKTAIKHAQKTGIGMVAVKNSGRRYRLGPCDRDVCPLVFHGPCHRAIWRGAGCGAWPILTRTCGRGGLDGR